MPNKHESKEWEPQEQIQPAIPLERQIHAPELPGEKRDPRFEKGYDISLENIKKSVDEDDD